MADRKYGRLFTEADVTKLVAYAFKLGRDRELNVPAGAAGVNVDEFRERVIREVEARCVTPYTFPADEPLFLLRGQDAAAPDAIEDPVGEGDPIDYYDRAKAAGAALDGHLEAVCQTAEEMRRWQAANPDRVKVPDA